MSDLLLNIRQGVVALMLALVAFVASAAARVDTIAVSTAYIESPGMVVVAAPEGEGPFPVVYLLNGYGGNHLDWGRHVDLGSIASRYGMVLVCPDGRDSWYWDSPIDPEMQMESYIVKDLVPAVDSLYPVSREPSLRAVTGLSMGGHGAFWLGVRHPDIFGNIGSMSGGLDITRFPDRWKTHLRLGRYAANPGLWSRYSVASLADSIVPGRQAIIFDCGESDFFIEVNDAWDRVLALRGVPHEYSTRPGNHSWPYWVESLSRHLDFFKKRFDE